MKTEVKKIDQHKRGLSVEIQGDVVKQKFDQVYKRINKEAKVPGFRPGNVPRDILERHYSSLAHQETLKELIPEVYSQALKETSLEPVSMPEISQVNLGKDSLSFKASLEVKPSIDLKKYKNLTLNYKPIQVTAQEIDKAIDKLKENYKQTSDEDWLHSLGYPDITTLREVLERQIYLEKTRLQQLDLQNTIIEQLLKQTNFQVPSSLMNQQLDSLVKQAELDLAMRGLSKDQIEKQRGQLRKNLEPQAQKQTRTFLVLEEVAKKENIAQDDKMIQRTIEFLLRQADWGKPSKLNNNTKQGGKI